ncbi:DeoR/GlpR family DNA-binding transcription regulator [Tessaracoccus sp. ZS01]|uniref:DeoR/GlpR family DNA-binding transcription regulator n=1 Tax=Tessaracoccus sp. ZS01 TaxID=1906324 RepID=UPI00096D719A|nr:DeoR/GlpR family DNA-binding transcription regulator [Tessaracoccus sp. ZS01]MCG6567724.1 DeoR/GlpR transcriptional regulator [Tessaracoccus sp. ZS01]OMG55792.1 hypothetical protein BJN44_08875 [Tessaracoccus sp. ZS01]
MLKSARHDALLRLLHARGPVAVTEVAGHLGASPATVRRDIAEMEEQGLVERTWGGVQLQREIDDPFQEALGRRGASKQRIGAAAAALIPDGATVILDIGTTAHYVALAMEATDVTVLTASLPTFEHFRATQKADIVLLGGRWSEQYQCLTGVQVSDALARQHADLAFLGCSGIADSGRIRDTSYAQSDVKRAIRAASSKAYLLADADKFPGKGGSSPFDIDELDGLITDAHQIAPSLTERCASHNIEIRTV